MLVSFKSNRLILNADAHICNPFRVDLHSTDKLLSAGGGRCGRSAYLQIPHYLEVNDYPSTLPRQDDDENREARSKHVGDRLITDPL